MLTINFINRGISFRGNCSKSVFELFHIVKRRKLFHFFVNANSDINIITLRKSKLKTFKLLLGKIPLWLRGVFLALFAKMLLETASLSALLILGVLSILLIILKYRAKSFFILTFMFVGGVIGITILLSIPQFREIDAIAGLIIRITEKLSYIPRGRWDLLTTDRPVISAKRSQEDTTIPAEYFSGNYSEDICYYGLCDVSIQMDGETLKLEDAIRDGCITVEELTAYARIDAREGV